MGGNNGNGDGDRIRVLSALTSRVGHLENDMAALKTDIKWIKILVAPTFLITFVSLLLMIAKCGVP